MRFVSALERARVRVPLMFEPLPPSRGAAPGEMEDHLEALADALHGMPGVDAVNVPEIIGGAFETVPAVDHALAVQGRTGIETLVNSVVAHVPEAQLPAHVEEMHACGIHHTILVGGESSRISYPGPPVARANAIAAELCRAGEQTIGNICIPFRRRPGRDEPDRMVEKTAAGADLFTSQIVLEPVTFRRLMRDYERACTLGGVRPAVVFLGLAPVTEERDLSLLKHLGVEVPPHVERDLLWDPGAMRRRSLELNLGILRNVLETMRNENIQVPLGLNVEQVSQHNWDASVELATEATLLLEEHRFMVEDQLGVPATTIA